MKLNLILAFFFVLILAPEAFSQEGEMKWRYQLTSSSDLSNSFATRFGWNNRVPMLARAIPAGTTDRAKPAFSLSLMNLDLPNLLLVNARPSPSEDGVILHLRETEGDHAILDIPGLLNQTGTSQAFEVNVLGEELRELTKPTLVEQYETRFILLKN